MTQVFDVDIWQGLQLKQVDRVQVGVLGLHSFPSSS
jgi:hypothetical protein